MNLWWKCPNCKGKVDFTTAMSEIFSVDNKADFCPKSGLWFHTISCDCGAYWVTSISSMNIDKNE